MPLLTPNTNMPFNITRISHVVLTSRDLDATRYFYESGLGLEVTFHDSERLTLRAIEEAWVEHATAPLPRVRSTSGAMVVCLVIHLPRPRSYAAAMLRRRASIVEYVGQNAGLCFSVF